MKKALSILLCLAMVLAMMAGCCCGDMKTAVAGTEAY